jgi:hypothetical protein
VIRTFRERYPGVVVGLSDHQDGIAMALVAHMLGARVIEKHFTLSHSWKGTDHAFSLMPEGMRKLVRDLQRIVVRLRRCQGDQPSLRLSLHVRSPSGVPSSRRRRSVDPDHPSRAPTTAARRRCRSAAVGRQAVPPSARSSCR